MPTASQSPQAPLAAKPKRAARSREKFADGFNAGQLAIAQDQAIHLVHSEKSAAAAETTRVNARVDAATSRKLSEIMLVSGMNVTETLRSAIDALHEKQGLANRGAMPELDALIGAYKSGRTDNSVRYKEIVGQAVAAKFEAVTPKFGRP